MAGWALFLSKTGILKFVYNWFGKEFTEICCSDALAVGVHEIKLTMPMMAVFWSRRTF